MRLVSFLLRYSIFYVSTAETLRPTSQGNLFLADFQSSYLGAEVYLEYVVLQTRASFVRCYPNV